MMDFDQLTYDMQHAPGIQLLRAEHAPLIISFLHRQYKREPHVVIPFAELTERLADMLEALNEQSPGRFPRPAQSYLTEWANEQHRFIHITTPTSSEVPLVELTAETERTIGWLEELHPQPFVGTESRFLYIVQLLRDILQKSTEDPAERLAQLEQQRDALQEKIDQLRETGVVDDLYNTTQLKERFFEACNGARQLLRDFRLVEDHFRDIAHALQKAQLESNVRKGDLVAFVLDADSKLKSSDQGRSFYTFWDFLMTPSQQDELNGLLDAVQRQPDLQPVIHQGGILQHLPSSLLAAGVKVVQSNAGLAQQLRRLLDEQSIAERHRVRAIVSEIKQMAFRVIDTPPDEITFIEIEGPPEARLVMEYGLWEPGETFSVAALPVNADNEEPAFDDLRMLHTQFHIDKSLLHRNIEELLKVYSQVTLADVLVHYPPEKGLSEVLAYCTLAADDPDHSIDERQTETIELPVATPSGQEMRTLTIPRVLYQRRTYAD
jgi:cell division protein FtsB